MMGLGQGIAAVKPAQVESLREALSSFSPLTIERLAEAGGCKQEELLPFFESWLRESYVDTLGLTQAQFRDKIQTGCSVAKESFDQTRIQ